MKNNQGHSKHGGARPGAGRPKGSKLATRTRKVAERLAEDGITPLEHLLRVMRAPSQHEDPKVQIARELMRFEAAKAAAPYIHPRLAAVEVMGADGGPVLVQKVAREIVYGKPEKHTGA